MVDRRNVAQNIAPDILQQQRSLYSGFLKSRFEQIRQIERAGRTLKGTVSFLRHLTLAR
jgi:hypothetical protein